MLINPPFCLKCAAPLPHSMQMNTADLRELPKLPQMGDIGICGGCGWIMIYTSSYSVRNPTNEEGRIIWQNTEILAIRKSMLDRL